MKRGVEQADGGGLVVFLMGHEFVDFGDDAVLFCKLGDSGNGEKVNYFGNSCGNFTHSPGGGRQCVHFMLSGMAENVEAGAIDRGMLSFSPAIVAMIGILPFFPKIVLFLPERVMG